MNEHLKVVRGWLSVREAETLAMLATDKTVLEIGSYEGRSTIALAQTATIVHSVDWHRGDEGTGQSETLAVLWGNLHRYGLRDRVVLHVGRAEQILPLMNWCFDLIFIDGAHDEESVRRDTQFALGLSSTGSTIAWHDCSDGYPQIQKIVTEIAGTNVAHVDSLAYWRR